MKNLPAGVIIAIVILYCLSPLDLCPGVPVDDLLVVLFGAAQITAKKKVKARQEHETIEYCNIE